MHSVFSTICLICKQFSAKRFSTNRLAPLLWCWRPDRKFWIFHYIHLQQVISLTKTARHRRNRSGTVNSNTVNSKFLSNLCQIPVISCLKRMVNSNTVNSYFHLFGSKSLPKNDFELTVSDQYYEMLQFQKGNLLVVAD